MNFELWLLLQSMKSTQVAGSWEPRSTCQNWIVRMNGVQERDKVLTASFKEQFNVSCKCKLIKSDLDTFKI